MAGCPLVFVEWVDAARPVPEWGYLSAGGFTAPVHCVSVGWLIHDGPDVKALAPNMGEIGDETSIQACGVIRIPSCAVLKMTRLKEPKLKGF